MDERERLERLTARNLQGLELERAGRIAEAIELYEQNIAEGFEGDWPYGRLVAIYERLIKQKLAAQRRASGGRRREPRA